MLIGYCRTSTADQRFGLEAQNEELIASGCEKIFSEQVSSVAKREQLEAALDFAREGDTIVIVRADRMSRGVGDLLGIIERLERKGVALRILSFGGGAFDTKNATSKLILTVLAATAAWEREVGRERQIEGIRRAKLEGKYRGRSPSARNKSQQVLEMRAKGMGVTAIANELGISKASTYRIIGEMRGINGENMTPEMSQ